MAAPENPTVNHPALIGNGERIENVDVSTEMQDSFLEYAYSVIYSRALPTRATDSSRCSDASSTR